MSLAIEARDIRAGYGEDDVLRGLDLELSEAELLGVLGPNGCGKSTLIRALTAVLPLRAGSVALRGRCLSSFPRRELASTVAVVPQRRDQVFNFTVYETVMMGRTPYVGRFQRERSADRRKALEALELTDCAHLAHRFMTDLSGGEQQRVHIARALAQDTGILLLDEPTTHLDINYQVEVFELLLHLRDERGMALVCVSHDVNFAAEYCDRLLLMREGRALCAAAPGEAVTRESMARLYGLPLPVEIDPVSGRPHVVLRRRGLTEPASSEGVRVSP